MRIVLIVGPTGVGKSGRAEALARELGAPIVTVDRYQVFPELAVGTARPSPNEATGIERFLLTADRSLDQGELPPDQAWEALLGRIEQCKPRGAVILEGGSISVCTELLTRGLPGLDPVAIEYLKPDDQAAYRARVAARVQAMIRPPDGGRSMLDEISAVWRDPVRLAFIETIVGYQDLIALCRRRGVTPDALGTDPADREPIEAVTASHLLYAQDQVLTFDRLLEKHG